MSPRRTRPLRSALLLACCAALSACPPNDLPAPYRRLEVPRARLGSAEARARGRELYRRHCALCHGERADGRGPRQALSSRPADFTDGLWRQRTSARRVFWIIREGKPNTAMAGWKLLDDGETWDLVAYVLSVAREGP
ncbi:MAG TPA: cytochrome c [Thermoanaerobaculia bacterium]|nr:cytochrome c [Thermoanaerobaculia bacterium]